VGPKTHAGGGRVGSLELKPHRHLTDTWSKSRSNRAKAHCAQVEIGLAQVDVVENVNERTLSA